MTPAEREAHMLKKKEELRQKLKNKFAESRRVSIPFEINDETFKECM